MTNEQIVANAYSDFQAKLNGYREAIKKNDFAVAESAAAALKGAEKEYATLKKKLVFHTLKEKENPMREAIVMNRYGVVSHKVVREDGKAVDVEEDSKYRQIDLLEFAEYCNLSTAWGSNVEKFAQLLALMVANDLKNKDIKADSQRIERIKSSYFMKETSRKIDLGKTPTSISALTKLLQTIIDGIYFVNNGKGQNTVRVFSRDAHYLINAFTERSKSEVATLKLAKTQTLRLIIADILHVIITERGYGLDFKESKEKASTESKTSAPAEDSDSKASETEDSNSKTSEAEASESEPDDGYGSEDSAE